jgi:hypothetical protein
MTDVLAECHVFGTDGGYRTLAHSAGLTVDEVRQLEQFDFSVDSIGADAERVFADSGTAYLLPLRSGRFAIRRVLLDPQVDNYGRPALITASIILTEDDYISVACVDGGPAGSGLASVVHRMEMWRGMCGERRGTMERIRVPVLPGDGVRRLVLEDFELFDAWHTLLKGGEDHGAWVPRDSVYEARLLALPSVLARKATLQYHWGIGVMRRSVPRMLASYLDPSLIPTNDLPVQLPAGARFRSSFTEHAKKLVSSFPVSPWHPHREWLDLMETHKQTLETLEEHRAWVGELSKARDAAIGLAEKRRALHDELSRLCTRRGGEITQLQTDLTERNATVSQLKKQLIRWRIAFVTLIVIVIASVALWYWFVFRESTVINPPSPTPAVPPRMSRAPWSADV